MKEIHTEKKHGKAPRRIGGLIVSACVAAAALLSAGTAKASLLVYEGFNGYTTGYLAGQNTTNTVGLSGAYSGAGIAYQSTGLTFGNLSVSGGAVTAANYNTSTISVSLSSSAATTGTLWSSHLVKLGLEGGSTGGNDMIAVGSDNHFRVYSNLGTAGASTLYAGSSRSDTWKYMTGSSTYLCITKTTNVGIDLSSGQAGTQRTWYMTSDQFATWEANGLTETYLNSAVVGTGSDQIFARTGLNSVTSGNYLFDQTQTLNISAQYNTSILYDELRYGTTLGDVIVVPEPSTLTLMLVAGIAGAAALRRRQAA